jgi:protein N-terminal methyltransferase
MEMSNGFIADFKIWRRIGRITEGLLLKVANQVDIIEPVAKFTAALEAKDGIRNIYNVGLEDWLPAEHDQYDLIWNQWCVGHLTDEQLVQYLERCKKVLNPDGGIIVVKENLSTIGVDEFDSTDSSVTRLVHPLRGGGSPIPWLFALPSFGCGS